MHVVVLADELFSTRERTLLRRIEVGFADEGVLVTHAVPAATVSDDSEAFSRTVAWPAASPLLGRARRASMLLERVLGAPGRERAPIGMVHVFGGSAWELGLELARAAGVPVALEIWRRGLTERARHFHAGTGGPPILLIAPDPAIERLMLEQAPDAHVRLAPWGVHVKAAPRSLLPDHKAASIMITGPGRDAGAYVSAFGGVVQAARGTDAMVFVDADAAARAGVWSEADRLDALGCVSLIDGMEARRDLVLEGDLLVQPEPLGEQRSLLLDAMGAGMAVVAAEDPLVSWLIDGTTAVLVGETRALAWREAVGRLLADRTRARTLGATAREHVAANHRASAQIARILDAYDSVASPEAIPFDKDR